MDTRGDIVKKLGMWMELGAVELSMAIGIVESFSRLCVSIDFYVFVLRAIFNDSFPCLICNWKRLLPLE